MTQTTADIIREAMQPAGTRKPIYELRLTNPMAIQNAARRARAANAILERIESADPNEAAAVKQLSEALAELETAAHLLSPDEFGDYEGEPYTAAAHAQADIESIAAQLIEGVAPAAPQLVNAERAITAAGLDWLTFWQADSERPIDERRLQAIGGVYYIDAADIPGPEDDDPPPSSHSPSPSSDSDAGSDRADSPTAAELNAAADTVWSASLSSPRSSRPLRHKSARELYAATTAIFRALPDDDRIDSLIHNSSAPDRTFGGDALADLTTADLVFDPNTENYEGDTVAEWRERGADAIAAIVAILRSAAEDAAPGPDDDPPPTDPAAGSRPSERSAASTPSRAQPKHQQRVSRAARQVRKNKTSYRVGCDCGWSFTHPVIGRHSADRIYADHIAADSPDDDPPTSPPPAPAPTASDDDAPQCPDCGSADIGRGSITGDPFCRACKSNAIAGADGVWAQVGRRLRRMAAAADAAREAREAAEASIAASRPRIAATAPIETTAVALDDAPAVWQPQLPQQQQTKPPAPPASQPADIDAIAASLDAAAARALREHPIIAARPPLAAVAVEAQRIADYARALPQQNSRYARRWYLDAIDAAAPRVSAAAQRMAADAG